MKDYKKCKGINKAFGIDGCGQEVIAVTRKYGLCQKCYINWLISDNQKAKETFNSLLITNKKNYDKKKKNEWTKKKLDIKRQLETKSELEKKLQKEINLIVRLIDKGHECISSGRNLGKNYDAGHLYTVGSNPTIRFNLFNIFAQSVHDNQHKSGNELEYYIRLESVFSKEFQGFVQTLKQIKPLHLTKDEIREKTSIARGIVKWLKLQEQTYSTKDRLKLRSDFNNQLGIYDQEWCEFKL